MNIQSMMAQAQKMQRDIAKKKEEIDKKIFPGKYQVVDVEVNGKKEIISIRISQDNFETADDVEMLADMIKLAINDAFGKVDAEIEEKMGGYGQALNGLF